MKLGLIGTHIAASQSPELHRAAGRLCGIQVTYDLIQLVDEQTDTFFKAFFKCRSQGYRGLNITYPFKERVTQVVSPGSDAVHQIGACNTVLFNGSNSTLGYNTDYSGFINAYRLRFQRELPGRVGIIGCGGVGKAIAFGLVDLGAAEIRLFDQDNMKSNSLEHALNHYYRTRIIVCTSPDEVADNANGLVNATPVGMHGYPGSPFEVHLIEGKKWIFDAVYTPVETQFINHAVSVSVEVLSGFELFFYQGQEAFKLFSGHQVDDTALRKGLSSAFFDKSAFNQMGKSSRR